jgi:hypothetical protein
MFKACLASHELAAPLLFPSTEVTSNGIRNYLRSKYIGPSPPLQLSLRISCHYASPTRRWPDSLQLGPVCGELSCQSLLQILTVVWQEAFGATVFGSTSFNCGNASSKVADICTNKNNWAVKFLNNMVQYCNPSMNIYSSPIQCCDFIGG